MDAKSKADFINSVNDGQREPEQSVIQTSTTSSQSEGEEMVVNNQASTETAFQPVPLAATVEVNEKSVFAHGLPSWDVVPPQIMVRRKKK